MGSRARTKSHSRCERSRAHEALEDLLEALDARTFEQHAVARGDDATKTFECRGIIRKDGHPLGCHPRIARASCDRLRELTARIEHVRTAARGRRSDLLVIARRLRA